MIKARRAWKFAAGCLLVCGSGVVAAEKPTPAQVLGFKPKQDGVEYTIPNGAAVTGCTVELEKDKTGGKGSGWILKDAEGRTLRRFYDSNGDGYPDVWSYYLAIGRDGVEVYREVDSNGNKKIDQYRWLNDGGSKWGVDVNEDGKIDAWRSISPEEVSQEVLQAVLSKDFARLQTLLLTEAEIQSLGLPAAEAAKLRESVRAAAAKFDVAKTKVAGAVGTTRWLHVELEAPQCLPADQTGAKADLIKYPSGLVLLETGGKNDWLQTGEMVQVSPGVWKLTEGPTAGLPTIDDKTKGTGGEIEVTDKEVQPLLEKLNNLDSKIPPMPGPGEVSKEFLRYNVERADLLEQIVAKVQPEKRDPWVRQVADSLSTAAQASPTGDRTAYERLVKLADQTAKAQPGSNLAAYVAFREMTADYAVKLTDQSRSGLNNNVSSFSKIQDEWLERLAKFVTMYPKSEDAPDALLQLGMVSEFVGKEDLAKKWYQQLGRDFGDKPQAPKAAGALKRLDIEGKVFDLAGPKLSGGQFDMNAVRGKVVVVYYWATWNTQCVGDFAKLKLLLDGNAGKVELVAVNLDTRAEEALAHLQKAPAPGTHLYQPGGLESPLAVNFGVLGLPNLFLVGKDGKVISRTVQISNLEEEIKKALK